MTAPVPPPSRTSITIEAIADNVLMKLMGFVVFTGSGFFEYKEVMVPPSHTVHVVIFASIAAVGLTMMFGKAFLGVISGLLGLAGPYLPKFGKGRGDPDNG